MKLAATNRRTLIALAILVAFVAIVVPTCRMVGCSMGGMVPWGHHDGFLGLYSDCGGTWVTNSTPSALVPAGADALVLALFGIATAAMALMRPLVASAAVPARAAAPPPPTDPLGARFRI